MKKLTIIMATLFLAAFMFVWLAGPAAAAAPKAGYLFIGNSSSRIYHTNDCTSAAKISAANTVYFKTKKEALKAGYTPCKTCKPDLAKTAPTGCTTCTNTTSGSDCKACGDAKAGK